MFAKGVTMQFHDMKGIFCLCLGCLGFLAPARAYVRYL